jgi:uncharacterized protein YhbP (UPF0306 family)
MSEEVLNKLVEYLKTQNHMRLATVTTANTPQVHTVAYVSEGATVYFITDKNSRKAVNILGNPHVAYNVDHDVADWSQIQGIQMEGEAKILQTEEEIQKVLGLFQQKFPQSASLPEFEMVVIKVEPKEGFFLDNTLGFGHRDKMAF